MPPEHRHLGLPFILYIVVLKFALSLHDTRPGIVVIRNVAGVSTEGSLCLLLKDGFKIRDVIQS